MKDNPVEFKRAAEAARLLKAADILQQRGWLKRLVIEKTKRICILQALTLADGKTPHTWTKTIVPQALLALVRAKLPKEAVCKVDASEIYQTEQERKTQYVWEYNDYYCDGQSSAIQLLKDAAAATLRG